MVEIADWWGRPVEFDAEGHTVAPRFNGDTGALIQEILRDYFDYDCGQGGNKDFLLGASVDQLYLYDKMVWECGIVSGRYLRVEPRYLTPEELGARIDYVLSDKQLSDFNMGLVLRSTLHATVYDADKSAADYLGDNIIKSILYVYGIACRGVCPHVAKMAARSSDAYYVLNRWGIEKIKDIEKVMDERIQAETDALNRRIAAEKTLDSFSWDMV